MKIISPTYLKLKERKTGYIYFLEHTEFFIKEERIIKLPERLENAIIVYGYRPLGHPSTFPEFDTAVQKWVWKIGAQLAKSNCTAWFSLFERTCLSEKYVYTERSILNFATREDKWEFTEILTSNKIKFSDVPGSRITFREVPKTPPTSNPSMTDEDKIRIIEDLLKQEPEVRKLKKNNLKAIAFTVSVVIKFKNQPVTCPCISIP